MQSYQDIHELLSRLRDLGISVQVDKDKLRINAPKGALNASLRETLSRKKPKIIKYFESGEFLQAAEMSPIPHIGRKDALELSFQQKRLWFLSRLEPESAAYHTGGCIRLEGRLRLEILKQSLSEIVRRHETLRTTFREVDGKPVQVVLPEVRLDLTSIDLEEVPEEERPAALRRIIAEEVRRPFDLSTGPLLRTILVRLAPQEHALQLVMHHIITDGWSVGVLTREFEALYRAFCAGEPSPLADLPLQYADYAAWQRTYLQREILEEQLSYWKKQLGGVLAPLQLPADRPRPAVQSHRGARYAFDLPEGLLQGLKAFGRLQGATLFMTLLAAFQVLLYRYTGQADFAVGTPIANRMRPELEDLIGFFVNTLVLRAEMSGDPGFIEFLGRVRETTLGAFEHQELPFEKLVEALNPARDMSYAPLFQVMFVMQNAPRTAVQLPEVKLSPVSIDPGAAMFDLTLYTWENGQGLSAAIEYCSDLFDASTIERLAGHFGQLLQSIAADPQQRISQLSILPEAERRKLVMEWNATQADYPADQTLAQLFEAQAARTPEAVAVEYEGGHLTYAELNARANRLAHHLITLGVGPEVLVGLYIERSFEMLIGIYGIIKAGGAYVPLDPEYPPERISFMVQDSAVPVVLTQAHLAQRLGAVAAAVICLDADWDSIGARGTENPEEAAGPHNAAYVIYTSGSTGRPKGVVNEHRGIVNRLVWMQAQYSLTAVDRVLQKTPFSFDVSVWEFFWPLQVGACLVLAKPGGHKESAYLVQLIADSRITTLHFVPSMLRIFLEEEGVERCSGLKRVICSGEALPFDLQQRFFGRLDAQLHNLYGPTEAAVDVTCWACRPDSARSVVPIGCPVANTQIYILDAYLSLVPIGCSGELHIGGVQVARGYLNRPELTAEKFIPDPFSADPAARLYKTGDLARYLADGSIEYLGRIDFQVKIRGLRVELGEIEARLGQIEAIDKCVVVVREDRPGDQRLVAYYVLRSDFTPAVSDWRAQLSTRLPDYMVPQFFVQLDAIPLSANGKVDRRTLPEPEAGNVLERQDYVAPRTPVEHEIAAIWQEVLQLESVGIHDDFFELGGHSLLATQVISRVRRLFDVQVPLRRLFEAPTVEGLAAAVKEICAHPAGATPPQLPPVVPVARDAALPLSFAQERLWFLQQLEPQSTAYSMPTLFRWRGRLDLRCLQMAIDALAQRHEALRTTFAFAGDRPEQIIAGEAHLAIHREDLRHLDEEQREAKALQLAGGLFRQPFDLAAGPLFRMAVYQLAEDDHILLANMHHIISDHWSFGIMSREITQLYGAYAGGREAPLDALPVQYADFACCQRNWLQGEVLAFHLGYWKEKLGGDLTVLDLPADRPRPPVQTHNGAECSLELNAELVDNLGQVGRKAGASLFMVLLAAFKLLLHRLSGQTDIVVGTPVSGRNRLELEGLVGFFINTLVLRTDLSDDPTFEALLERVRETALGAYAHQEMPFEKLVEALSPRRDLSRTPLFQVFFNHIRVDDQAAQPTDLTLQTVGAIAPEAKFDLTLYVQEQRDRIRLSAVYNADLFDAERMAAMLAQYQYLLTQAAEQPDLKIGAYSLVRDEDRAVLPDLSQTLQEEWPGPVTERLAHWARLAGRSIALEDAWAVFSYTDLEQMSNRLAWRLAGSGVVPGDVVAVYGHRSAGLVLALLGIMKVGAAFLILDPDYPSGRLKHMLEGADPRGLIELAAAGSAAALIDGRPLACRVTLPRDKQGQQALLADDDGAPLGVAPGPDERAYIIFTSGTSGHPKGIVGTHRPLSHFLRWHCERFGFTAADRFSMLSGLSHDPLLRDIFTPLWAGARLCIPDPELALQPEALNGWMRRRRLTVAHLTPALSHVLAEGAPVQPTALRYLFFGGDTLDRRTVEKAAALAPGACCVNFYGTTETPQAMSHEVIEPGSRPALPETIPLGRGIEGVQLMVSNASGKPAGVGELGEIVVRTPYLCAGYLNDEVLTAEKFSVNPLGTSNRDRLYRTGDLGRYLPDGRVVFCGRRDSQVSIRGFRVELREIEAVLATCPGVRDCAVLVKNREPGDRYLAAFVVSNGGCALDAAVLKQYLGQCLPDFMIPAAMVPLGVLPLTPHGKIDRRHLDAMPIETGAASPDEWPLSETELRLAAIWKEVLGVDAVGVHDNFFDIGGHSLLSIQVIARLEKETGIRINPREFTYQSLGQVAAVLEERMASMKTAMPSGRQKKISNRLKHKIHRLFQRR